MSVVPATVLNGRCWMFVPWTLFSVHCGVDFRVPGVDAAGTRFRFIDPLARMIGMAAFPATIPRIVAVIMFSLRLPKHRHQRLGERRDDGGDAVIRGISKIVSIADVFCALRRPVVD